MYAVISDGGRQYCVQEGETVLVDLKGSEPGATVEFENVLAVGGGDGGPKLGQPTIAGAKVVAEVVGNVRTKKVQIQDYKRRKNFRKHKGHRQQMTEVRIRQIVGG